MIQPDADANALAPTDGSRAVTVQRHRAGAQQTAQDRVAEEWPVALVYNGISHAVMMTTPRDLEAFAAGFSLSEGIIRDVGELRDIDTIYHEGSAEVHINVLQGAFVGLKDKRRSLAGRTGCGVCGIESLDLLDLTPEVIAAQAHRVPVSDQALQRAAGALRSHQTLMQATGGVHAAAWCAPDGSIRTVFEDVGRHNALDKLIGSLALARASFQDGFVFLSSRASYELVRKSARVGIPMVATISAPSSLAIRIAQQAGIRLVSFCRDDGFVDYETDVAGALLASEKSG